MRWVAILALCLGLACPSEAGFQTLLHAGHPATGAAAYVGPGDLVASASGWWGLRCYNAAYSGNVARVKSPSDVLTTTITCTGNGVLSSTGTAIGTTCAVSCTIDILYDQTGGGKDLSNATEVTRPFYLLTCAPGTLGCMSFVGATHMFLANATGIGTLTQPFTLATVYEQLANVAGTTDIFIGSACGSGLTVGPLRSFQIQAGLFGGGPDTPNSVFRSAIGVANGASSLSIVNNSSSTVDAGANTFLGDLTLGYQGCLGGGDGISMYLTEIGIWPMGFNGTQQTNMFNNQKTYWGF